MTMTFESELEYSLRRLIRDEHKKNKDFERDERRFARARIASAVAHNAMMFGLITGGFALGVRLAKWII